MQVGDDCAWWLMHYAEVEARMEHGEGLGACLTPGHWMRKPQIKHQLRLASQQLEAARAKWLQDEEMQIAQTEAVRKMIQKQMGEDDLHQGRAEETETQGCNGS